jgi:hypothetical protein
LVYADLAMMANVTTVYEGARAGGFTRRSDLTEASSKRLGASVDQTNVASFSGNPYRIEVYVETYGLCIKAITID